MHARAHARLACAHCFEPRSPGQVVGHVGGVCLYVHADGQYRWSAGAPTAPGSVAAMQSWQELKASRVTQGRWWHSTARVDASASSPSSAQQGADHR